MDKEYTLEEIRKFCSDFIRKHLGEEYDATPWMDKLRLYGLYLSIKDYEKRQMMSFSDYIKQKEIEDGQIHYFGQNEQETKT